MTEESIYEKLYDEFDEYHEDCRLYNKEDIDIKLDFLFNKIVELQKEIFYLKSKEVRFK